MSHGFFERLFTSDIPSRHGISDSEVEKIKDSDMSEAELWNYLLTLGGRRTLAAKMTPIIRNRQYLLSPFMGDMEVKESVANMFAYIKLASKFDSHYIDATGSRVVTLPLKDEMLVPVFTISELVSLNLDDIRDKNISAIRIAFMEGLLRFSAKEKSRHEVLVSACNGKPFKEYLVVHNDITILSWEKPDIMQMGFTIFEGIGMAVVEI